MYESFGPVAEVNGFQHEAFKNAVVDWNSSLYPFPLYMYEYKELSEPQAILSIDYRQPLYTVALPTTQQIKRDGIHNCTVIWVEYYIGDLDNFEDKEENWITPYQKGHFVHYQKQLLYFREAGKEVREGDEIAMEASLDETLTFHVKM